MFSIVTVEHQNIKSNKKSYHTDTKNIFWKKNEKKYDYLFPEDKAF